MLTNWILLNIKKKIFRNFLHQMMKIYENSMYRDDFSKLPFIHQLLIDKYWKFLFSL